VTVFLRLLESRVSTRCEINIWLGKEEEEEEEEDVK
jgi:hypothetical protein